MVKLKNVSGSGDPFKNLRECADIDLTQIEWLSADEFAEGRNVGNNVGGLCSDRTRDGWPWWFKFPNIWIGNVISATPVRQRLQPGARGAITGSSRIVAARH